MNTWGNIGGAISPTALAYLVRGYSWNMPFLVTAGLCVIAAVLYLKIDASERMFVERA
jgi:sugar phosphate permease